MWDVRGINQISKRIVSFVSNLHKYVNFPMMSFPPPHPSPAYTDTHWHTYTHTHTHTWNDYNVTWWWFSILVELHLPRLCNRSFMVIIRRLPYMCGTLQQWVDIEWRPRKTIMTAMWIVPRSCFLCPRNQEGKMIHIIANWSSWMNFWLCVGKPLVLGKMHSYVMMSWCNDCWRGNLPQEECCGLTDYQAWWF